MTAACGVARPPSERLANFSRHRDSYLSFVLHGRYTERAGRRERDCAPFGTLFHPAGEYHSDRFHSEGACLNLELPPDAALDDRPRAFVAASRIPVLAARLFVEDIGRHDTARGPARRRRANDHARTTRAADGD